VGPGRRDELHLADRLGRQVQALLEAPGGEVARDGLAQVAGGGQRHPHLLAGEEGHLVHRGHVERVGHRQQQRAPPVLAEELEGQHLPLAHGALRQEREDRRRDVATAEEHHRHLELPAQGDEDLLLLQEAQVDQRRAQPPAPAPLPVQRRAELAEIDVATLDEHLSDGNLLHDTLTCREPEHLSGPW
jgi:hypothetical protein